MEVEDATKDGQILFIHEFGHPLTSDATLAYASVLHLRLLVGDSPTSFQNDCLLDLMLLGSIRL